MTILVAWYATDGIVVISDRMETYSHGPPRNVTKYYLDKRGRFYVSLAGDGKLAEGVLRCLARSRTGPADVLARLRDIAKTLHARQRTKTLHVNGFLIVVERQGPKLYSIDIDGGHVDVLGVCGGVHMHGDGRAQVLCKYITTKARLADMQCEEAAWHLHVLASDVAEHVDSVGERGKYGFDLVLFGAAGGAKLLERHTAQHGGIEVRFRMVDRAGLSAMHGGGTP